MTVAVDADSLHIVNRVTTRPAARFEQPPGSALPAIDCGGDMVVQGAGSFTTMTVGGVPVTGGAVADRTATVRITDDDLSGLPSASQWTVVVTAGGSHLQCSIAASVGDRIEVFGNFMRRGAHYLDWVLLDNTGAINYYASTESGSPGSEGSPSLYPSTAFSYATAAEMFTVAANHISGGQITVALAHQGTGTGNGNIVYAYTVYPWRVRLKNIGPQPS